MRDMGTLGGPLSHAAEASRDGSVIIGWSLTSGSSASNHAFWWTAVYDSDWLCKAVANVEVTLETWDAYRSSPGTTRRD